MRCFHCGTRISNDEEFRHRGLDFCTECVSEMTSWFLDGGMVENPETFDYVL